jgi:hypothetical protein
MLMRRSVTAILVAVPLLAGPAIAQQAAPSQNVQTTPGQMQNEADKGIKTQNSGASGYVGEQDKPGSAASMPGDRTRADSTSGVATSPSAPNAGPGIAGAPGNKNGPPAQKGTVGSSSQNPSVQQQDSSNVKGLPGNKSGPPAKR